MTNPEEAAKKLIDNFKPYAESDPFYSKEGKYIHHAIQYNSKQCALVCVDKIWKAMETAGIDTRSEEYKFWEEVKQELEK